MRLYLLTLRQSRDVYSRVVEKYAILIAVFVRLIVASELEGG